MSDTEINASVNVTEDVLADVEVLESSSALVNDDDNISLTVDVDLDEVFDAQIESDEDISISLDESIGAVAADHRVLLHRDAANQHPMSSISGLNDALTGLSNEFGARISNVEDESALLTASLSAALLRIGDLQNQVDGNITTWFYAIDPTMSSPPVTIDPNNPDDTGWDTDAKKNKHKGDLYYNTVSGYAWRFMYSSGVYSWQRISDVDVVKALNDAAHAQDTADSKRRVFYGTASNPPTPPYDEGDLWVQGNDGDILRCAYAKAEDEPYSRDDWVRACKYTDDYTANLALTSANGKTTVFHQASKPSGGVYKQGDTWFNSTEDYAMYTYDEVEGDWIKEEFGTDAIENLSITNGKIANATIENGKIVSLDAAKITTGSIISDVMKTNVITAINGNDGDVKISGNKINIQGVITAINSDTTTTIDGDKITTGTLSGDAIIAGTVSASAVDAESGAFDVANIPDLNAAKITAGDITADRMKANAISAINLDATSATIAAAHIGDLDASKITSGDITADRMKTNAISAINLDATSATIDGAHIGNLSATKITSDDIAADRMKTNAISAINLDATSATIDNAHIPTLTADKMKTNVISAINLDATSATIDNAHIPTLTADKMKTNVISAINLDATSATIDNAHIPTLTADKMKTNVISAINLDATSATISDAHIPTLEANKIDVLTKDGSSGIYLHPSANTSPSTGGDSVKIDDTGMEVFSGGTLVAKYGTSTTIGQLNKARTIISPNEITMITDSGAEALNISGSGTSESMTKYVSDWDFIPSHPASSSKSFTLNLTGAASGATITVYICFGSDYSFTDTFTITNNNTTQTGNVYGQYIDCSYRYVGSTKVLTLTSDGADDLGYRGYSYTATIVSPAITMSGTVSVAGDINLSSGKNYKINSNPLIAVEEKYIDNQTVNANSYLSNASISTTKTGYTPIGVVGWYISGTNNSYVFPYRMQLSGSAVLVGLRNTGSSAATVKITVAVLYIAT